MDSLNEHVREYVLQLGKGRIQKAYKGIMSFMTDLRAYLGDQYPGYTTGSLYFGYMDMTCFAFTPSTLKNRQLKIAIVFLHEECKFELWLAGNNRKIQAEYVKRLRYGNLGGYTLSRVHPGVDSIIAAPIIEQPDFDNPIKLRKQVEGKVLAFAEDMNEIVSNCHPQT